MNSNDAPLTYPAVRYAAVHGVEIAGTNDQHPDVEFRPGGVMLVELLPGEFAIILTAQPCSHSVGAMSITPSYEERLQVRWSSVAGRFLHGPSSTHLRFANRLLFTDFNRVLWEILSDVHSKMQILRERLEDIAFSNPSRFTDYCRQYLGDDYINNLEDSEEADTDENGSTLGDQADDQSDDANGAASGDEGARVPSEDGSEEGTIRE